MPGGSSHSAGITRKEEMVNQHVIAGEEKHKAVHINRHVNTMRCLSMTFMHQGARSGDPANGYKFYNFFLTYP